MKEKLVNLALLIASVIFSLLALEVGIRAYVALRQYEHGWQYQFTYQFTNFRHQHAIQFGFAAFDPELGWVPSPGVPANEYPWRETVTILDDGTRSNGREEVRDTTERILAVGDSFTFGD